MHLPLRSSRGNKSLAQLDRSPLGAPEKRLFRYAKVGPELLEMADEGLVLAARAKAKVNGREDIAPFALRVTMVFRPEGGTWKVVHRHADPITSPQPAEWVFQQ